MDCSLVKSQVFFLAGVFLCLSPPVSTSLLTLGIFTGSTSLWYPFRYSFPFHAFFSFFYDTSLLTALFLSSLNHDIGSMVSVRHPVISGSLQPHGLCPARFLCPCDSLDKNTRVGCISSSRESSWPSQGTYISCVSCTAGRFFTTEPLGKVKVAQSCPTLCNPVEPLGKPPLISGQIFSILLLLNLSTFPHFHGHHPR